MIVVLNKQYRISKNNFLKSKNGKKNRFLLQLQFFQGNLVASISELTHCASVECSVFVDFAQKQFEHKSFQRQTRLQTHTHTLPPPPVVQSICVAGTVAAIGGEESQYERRLQPRKLTARFTRSNSERQHGIGQTAEAEEKVKKSQRERERENREKWQQKRGKREF